MVKPLNLETGITFKKVNKLPIDDKSAGLAWFSSKPISPANNLSVTDLSGFIPENSYSTEINASPRRIKK